jgi:D-glycero-alpha-D-manno-heptose-7-phosphate kinase
MGQDSCVIRSRAPVRIDLAGGWTDVAEFAQTTPGAVVNAAIDLWTYVTLKPCAPEEGIKIFSADFEEYVTARDIEGLEYDGRVDLVKAAVCRLGVSGGLSIQTRSDAPPGSGLGTSAAMGVALIGAIGRLRGSTFLDFEMAELAAHIERHDLGIKGGKQDHYASALGGVNFMEFFGETVRTARIPVSEATRMYLEKHLLLVYTGKSRLSGDIHTHVWSAFRGGQPATVSAIEEMKQIARLTKDQLIAGNCDRLADLLNDNWRCQKALHPSVTNPELDELFGLALQSGAKGGKACGAGGGGCVLFLAEAEREHALRRALEKVPGITILPFSFQPSGLTIARFYQ